MRRFGGLLLIFALAALAVYLLAQPEAASVPVASNLELWSGGAIEEDPTSPPPTVTGNEQDAPIRVAPFRDPEPLQTKHLTVRGTVSEDGVIFPKKKCIGGARVYLKEDSADKACAVGETKPDGSYLLETDWPTGQALVVLRVWAEKDGWVAWQRSAVTLPTHIAAYPERTYDLYLCSPLAAR